MSSPSLPPARSLRPFLTLWIGQVFSLLGSQLVQFSLIWWLTQQTGSATVLAVASIFGLVPQVVLGPFVGPLVDRWNRRRTMIVADAIVALATLALAVLFWLGLADIWHVYVILFVRALGGTFHGTAMAASTSLMVPEEHLTRIQGLNQILNGGLNIIAAPLGALLLALLPIQSILLIDLVTAVIAIFAVFIVHVPQPARAAEVAGVSPVAAYWRDLREGLHYMLGWRGLLYLAAVAMLINLVLGPTTSFMPLLVTEHFQGTAWHLGALEAAIGVGVLLGGLLLGVWGGFKRRVYTSLLGVVGIGVGTLLVGVAPAALFPLAVVGMFISGAMMSLANGPLLAILQATVTPAMQGRVFTLSSSAATLMMPLGLAFAGPLADVIGVRNWFVISGVVTVLAGLGAALLKPLVNIEQEREAHLAADEVEAGSESGPVLPLEVAKSAT